jgi:hypothetical protein
MADLDVIRRTAGWNGGLLARLDTIDNALYWMDHDGESLPIPILGAQLAVYRTLTPVEQEFLLAACVDITIGLRPYIKGMG